MSRPSRCPLRKSPSGRWSYDLPPSLSETGRRQRKTFKTRKLAELSREADFKRNHLYGMEGRMIPASLAQDAVKASELLATFDVTLYEVPRDYVERRKRDRSSKPFSELWDFFCESRANKSDTYNRTLNQMGEKLRPLIGKKLVSQLGHDELRTAIRQSYPTAFGFNLCLRSVSAAMNVAVREGWCPANPCKRIAKIDTGRKEIEVLTLNQCRKLFELCKDYKKDESLKYYEKVDATMAYPAIALMLFAGVRPHETTRLDWSDIDMEEGNVLVRNTKAKTDRSRYFKMPATLRAWLEQVPETERFGPIVPPSWKRVIGLIRKKAGISDEHDILRKTFATAHLGHFKDVNLTRSIMGHEVGDVLFQHYRGLMKPSDASAFWDILPSCLTMNLEKAG